MKNIIYKVLIVEDDEIWLNPMKCLLEQESQKQSLHIQIDSALTAEDAKELLDKKFYHILSLDQHMPEQHGGLYSTDTGIALGQLINKNSPASSFLVFTGRDSPEEVAKIARTAGIAKAKVWHKSSVDSDKATNKYSAKGWAEQVCELFKNDYLAEYINKVRRSLPVPFASGLHKLDQLGLNDAFFKSNGNIENAQDTVHQITHFWEQTLSFVWLQCCALNEHYNKQKISDFPALPKEKLKNIETFFSQLSSEQREDMQQWLCYLEKDGADKQISAEYFLSACHVLNKLQEQLLLNPDSREWQENLLAIKQGFFATLDAASYWAGHPLLYQLTKIKDLNNSQSSFKVYSPHGTEYPWPYQEFRINNRQNIDSQKVYLGWKGSITQGLELLDLHPFFKVKTSKESNRLQLFYRDHANTVEQFYLNTETEHLSLDS